MIAALSSKTNVSYPTEMIIFTDPNALDSTSKYVIFRRAQILLQHLNETLMASSCSFQGLDTQMGISHTHTLVSK